MTTIYLPPDGRLRAITIHEPDASLCAMGFKTIENRGYALPKEWQLPITIAIHASKSDVRLADEDHWDSLSQEPRIIKAFYNDDCTGEMGKAHWYGSTIIGLVDVIACVPMPDFGKLKGQAIEDATDKHFSRWPIVGGPAPDLPRGIWAFGPMCWVLDNPRRFEQGYTCRGLQRIWAVPEHIQASIQSGRKIMLGAQSMPLVPEVGDGTEPNVVGKTVIEKVVA